ncbi:hypothetical protein AB3S75_019757 [Citrus x aurantiifolia]
MPVAAAHRCYPSLLPVAAARCQVSTAITTCCNRCHLLLLPLPLSPTTLSRTSYFGYSVPFIHWLQGPVIRSFLGIGCGANLG